MIPPRNVTRLAGRRQSKEVLGLSRSTYDVLVVAFVYMVTKTVVMAMFTFITVAIGEFDPGNVNQGIFLIAIFNVGNAATALPVSEYFSQLGRFRVL